MAPSQKRKRGDRMYSQDSVDRARPSPHRPENLSLAHSNGANGRGGGGGGRRPSRGGGIGRGGMQQSSTPVSATKSTASFAVSPSPAVKSAMSPPPQAQPQNSAKSSQASQSASQRSAPEHSAVPAMEYPAAGDPPNDDPSSYSYSYITAERRQNWQESGRQAALDEVLSKVEEEDFQELGVYFQEVLHLVTEGFINPQDAGILIKEVVETSPKAEELDLPSLFLDNVAVILSPHYVTGKEDTGKEQGINQFLHAAGIDKKLVCTILDEKMLIALKIVRGTFDRMGIRHSTNVLYRQSGFNLLREESEGYSKLMTEFFTVTHNFKPDKETVEKTWEKVKALIGAFDLDVGRVLDITLDAFANNLIKHNKFFIRLLKYSDFWPQSKSLTGFFDEAQGFSTLPPWSSTTYPALDTLPEDVEKMDGLRHGRDLMFWDRVRQVGMQAFFELGGRRAIAKEEMQAFLEELRSQDVGVDKDKRKTEEASDLWATRTNTFPPQGNSIAAQILGFKLRFYASDARDPQDKLSVILIWLAALLIKIGFISLKDLYPHIYPSDDKMDELRTKLEKEKVARQEKLKPGAGNNALTAAGALSEGEPHSLPTSRPLLDAKVGSRTPLRTETGGVTPAGSTPSLADPAKPELPEPEDQKIILLRSLLLIGAIPDAMYILGRFPWLLDVHDDLPKYIYRLLHHMLRKVYTETQPLSSRASDLAPGKARIDVNNTPLLEARQQPRSIAWGNLEKIEWSEGDYGTSYRYYWDDWNDLVPVCQNVDDVFTLCDSFLNLVGHKIGRDSELLTKIVRIGVKSIRDDDSPANAQRWQKLAKRLLIPALSLTKEDPGTVNEAWELIKLFPVAVRYNIYSEWYGGQTSRLPDIRTAFDLSRMHTRDVLKRISKTNVKEMARSLAKVAYASPGIALHTGLNQIESYNNLIDTLIECIRYFTNIGFDVLIWSLLNSLGGSSRDRMQADGMLMSKWLQRLAEFTGKVCRRYYKDLDFKPLLLYVKDRLQKGDSTGLGVLGQLILSMGGIRSDQSWSEEQVIALSGRPTLRAQTLARVDDKRHESRSTSTRLVNALTSTSLTGKFLILIARERQQYLERESSSGAPIKVLSANLTGLQFAFVQYLDFLRSNFSIQDFDAVVPPLEALIRDYGIDPAMAFTISRPSIQHQIEQANKAQDVTKSISQPAANTDVEMTDASSTKAAPTSAVSGTDATEKTSSNDDTAMGDDSQPGTPVPVPSTLPATLHPVLQQVIERLKGALPLGFEDTMSMPFYVRFWQSSLADILVAQYDDEIKNVRNALRDLNNDRSDLSADKQKKKAIDRARLNQMDKDLQDEWRAAIQHMQGMRKTLKEERAAWFPDFPPSKHTNLTNAIVQDCLLPRIQLSEMDALFTAKFIFMVHKQCTPGFRIAKILARIFSEQQFIATLFMLTEREAKNLGIFLKEVLYQLKMWRENKTLYDKEGAGPNNENPGFAKKIRDDNTVDSKDPEAVFEHPDYQRLCFKWHTQLDRAIIHCLQSKEFMHVRNAILLLKQIHEFFPTLNYQGRNIQEQVQKLATEETRDDLKLSALSLLGDLKKMRMKWIPAAQFRPGEGPVGAARGATPSTRPVTPQPGSLEKKALNASAAEFKPRISSSSSTKGAEDGEIEDEKEGEDNLAGDQSQSESTADTLAPTSGLVSRPRTGDTPRASTPGTAAHPSPVPSRSDARQITPAAGPSSASRQDTNRASGQQAPGGTLPGGLPARPEGPIPPHRDLHRRPEAERTPTRPEAPRPPEHHGRLERPIDPARDQLRHRSRSPGHRSRNRTPESRLPRPEPERRDPAFGPVPPRELMDQRDSRLPRPPREGRDERHRGERDLRRGEPELRGPPQPNDIRDRIPRPNEPPARDSGPLVNPNHTPMMPGMNPERAALFAQDGPRDERKPGPDDDRKQGRRRGPSPTRDGPPIPRGESPRRHERSGPERPPRSGPRDRRDELSSTPSGPLGDRVPADMPRGRNELFPGSSRAPTEPSHGRLNQPEPRPQPDLNYGRLNAPATPEVPPSGPRGRAGPQRGGRAGPEPAITPSGPRHVPSSSSAGVPPPSPSVDRAPPLGPSANNNNNNSNNNHNPNHNHNRRGPIPPNATPNSASQDSSSDGPVPGIHPSRLHNIGSLPPVQTNVPTAPANNSAIPSGPRSGGHRSTPSQGSMPAPSPTGRFPPTGPAASAGGSMRGRSQIGIINGVLGDQQSPRNGAPSIRGRPSIGSMGSAPQSPTSGTAPQMPPPGQTPRSDSITERLERPGTSGSDEHRGGRRGGAHGSGPRDDGTRGPRHHNRSRSPRRDAADNAMRQSGDLLPRNGGIREEGGRRRESGEREGGQRDGSHREGRDRRSRGGEGHGRDRERDGARDNRRESRDSRGPIRNEDRSGMMPPQLGPFGPVGPGPAMLPSGMPPSHGLGPNGDMRGAGGMGGRRDDRDRRDNGHRGGGGGGGRDGSKRRRPDEGPPGGPGLHDNKRPRRDQ